MATAGAKPVEYKLVNVGTLELEHAHPDPKYIGIVALSANMLMVVDGGECTVRLHSQHDGRLLAISDRLESGPCDVCLIDRRGTQVAVTGFGHVEILSVEFTTGQSAAIRLLRTLDVTREFDYCYGVRALRSGGILAVSGRRKDNDTGNCWICWSLVTLEERRVNTIHKICKYGGYSWSYLDIGADDSTVYISCYAGDYSDNHGVYAFDVMDGKLKFLYRHSDLTTPTGISVDRRGYVYVCNWKNPPSIHQLTERGELMAIHSEGVPPMPKAMFWDDQQEQLSVTRMFSREVWKLHPVKSGQQDPVVPKEIIKMDGKSLEMYKKALRDGKEKVYNIRVMVVGHYGVGKTTLTKRLLGEAVKISERESTEGIDVHIECCKVSLATGQWIAQEKNAEQHCRLQRLANFLNERVEKQESSGMQEGHSQRNDGNKQDKGHHADTNIPQRIIQQGQSKTLTRKSSLLRLSQKTQNQGHGVDCTDPNATKKPFPDIEAQPNENEKKKDAVMEILHLINKSTDKLENRIVEYASLAMWDFAGQYIFYTTHQTFLTSRAIYLLVIDINQQVTDLIKNDQCFLDTEGIKRCKVHELIEIWLNSIHSCTPSHEAGIPPVILVGTHVDKIPQKAQQKIIDDYFKKIRDLLIDKPTIFHLSDEDIAIDNTQCDPRLEDLKRIIFELASKQPHWGEERPTRWLPLEQAIMTLKASGVRVVPFSLVEEINKSGSVRIENREELDLFLRFQHEIGAILYFSVEGLRENIVLDPQWMIDAQKSLITAEMFIKKKPAVTRKWNEFKRNGKLTQELIDAVWTKENNPEFHDNKEHILLLMEELNIIAKPKSFSADGKAVTVENYFLAPCMLSATTPREVISPDPHPEMESSSVLCYVFIQNFLPSPIFHRLLAACVTRWAISRKKNSENLIFCGCCVFDLDLHHRLTVFFRDHVIFARVARMGTTEKTPSSKLCIEVREFITMTLSKVIGYLGQNLRFELSILCPKSDGYSEYFLISVADLKGNVDYPCRFHDESHMIVSHEVLKFWFQEEECKTGDGGDTGISGKYGHVMISYDWGQKEKALWIKDQLDNNGYSVWMDVEDMGPKLSHSMAKAVELAHVVLVCMSERYKESKNCWKEATYADEKNKTMIPLKMEKDFTHDGWLGILTADKKYYDFSGKYPFIDKMRELLRELAQCYGRKFEEPRIVPFVSRDAKKNSGAASGSGHH